MAKTKDLVGDIFGWIGSVISVIFFIVPCVPFYNLIKEKITYKDTPGILLICSVINCIFWVVYGVKLGLTQSFITNAIGAIITTVWICIFLIFWVKKHALKSVGFIVLTLVVFVGIFCLFYFVVDPEITGYFAMVFNVLMYAAPGEKIYRVIKNKDYTLIPIFSTIAAFVNSACWLIYGICNSDIDIIVPNVLGLVFAVLQVILYLVIKYKYHKDSETKKDGEDNATEKKEEKESPEILKVKNKNTVPDSDKKLEIEEDKNAGARIESERVNVKKS